MYLHPITPMPMVSRTQEHNIWHYFIFMMHLRQKPQVEWTAQEKHFADCIAAKEPQKCFPINKSLTIESIKSSGVRVISPYRSHKSLN